MNEEKVMEVLRQVEWAGAVPHRMVAVAVYPPRGPGQCPWCGGWESEGHRDDCKLAALLDEANEEIEHKCCNHAGIAPPVAPSAP